MYPSYDVQLGHWVPVSLQQLSPDGRQYAYVEWVMPTQIAQGPTGPSGVKIHVVDVGAAADRVVYTTNSLLLSVVAFEPDGIYVTNQCFEGCGGVGGMWLFDPSTGQLKTILSLGDDHTDWRWVANGYAWGYGPWGPDTMATTVFRLNLSTGNVMKWFTPSPSVALVGLDGRGLPLLETQDPSSQGVELWDATSSTNGSRIFASSTVVDFGPASSGPCGTWIGSSNGLYGLTSTNSLHQLPTTAGVPPNGLEVAGPCVSG